MSAVATARIDLVRNLLARALDPSAEIGEAKNSADKMVTIARREGIDFPTLQKSLVPAVAFKPKPKADPEPPAECFIIVKFGKYAGDSLIEIGQMDRNYLAWLATGIKDSYWNDVATTVLRYLCGGTKG